jgi:hypothetical protein
MVRRNAQSDGAMEGDIRVMARLVHDVHQRRAGVGTDGKRAMAAGTVVVEEALAFGELARDRPWSEVGADRGTTLARRRDQGERNRRECGANPDQESCRASRSRASTMVSRTFCFSAGTSAGVSPAVSTGARTSTTAVERPKRQSCLGRALPVP